MTTTKLTTVDTFMRLTGEGRFDLIDGEVQSMAPAGGWHGHTTRDIVIELGLFARETHLGSAFTGETAFIIAHDPDTALCPDAAFVRADRLPPWSEQAGALDLAPDLAVEVRSPSERTGRLQTKIEKYLQAGTKLVWVIDPKRRTATVYRADGTTRALTEAEALDGEDVLPGFSVRLGALFG